jgi:hypothetical protein
MSADKDRGIRRTKQKRAKKQKKLERRQRSGGATKPLASAPSAGQLAA